MKHIVIPAGHVAAVARMGRQFDTEAEAIAAAEAAASENQGAEYVVLAIVAGVATAKPTRQILTPVVTRR